MSSARGPHFGSHGTIMLRREGGECGCLVLGNDEREATIHDGNEYERLIGRKTAL